MTTAFTERANGLIARIDAGEPLDRLGQELAELRCEWRALETGERERLRPLTVELANRTRHQPDGVPTSQPADEQAEARRALQGLENLRAPVAARRLYDGPPDPDALLRHYGLSEFRPGQREAVQAALDGRDALVIMPTGGGKSLTYLLPGLATPRLTVVVSPLIALMADQYRRLADGGHPAVMLASGFPEEHNREAVAAIRDGSARIVLCSPERFASRWFVDAVASRELALFAVDEAHCLSQWGHDFRPDYLRLEEVRERLGRPPTLACTATATPQVAAEIRDRLRLREPLVVHGGFDRPNLSFDVLRFEGRGATERKFATLAAILEAPENRPAIVYAGTRNEVDTVTERLRGLGRAVVGYHAGMEPDERAAAQFRFLGGDADVVVATNAFGMGIDKADVRSVVHYATPTSIEGYYQEAGRAGRDGLPARAVLLAMRADLGRLIRFNQSRPSGGESGNVARERGWAAYRAIERFTAGDDACRRRQILDHFGDRAAGAPAGRCCDVCDPVDWLPPADEIAAAAGAAARRRRQPAAGAPASASASELNPADLELYEALVTWRREAAAGKPAYTVAHNATLQAIAAARPADAAELLAIAGVGPAFIERHGAAVLEIITTSA